jgi:hypothetical protein
LKGTQPGTLSYSPYLAGKMTCADTDILNDIEVFRGNRVKEKTAPK